MDNSISINLGNGNNTMIPYSFIWTAKFRNSEDICQYDFDTGIEKRFQLVKDNFSNLEYFLLWNKDKVFTVDLINGLIYYNKELKEKLSCEEEKKNIRLIFFRRHQIKIKGLDLKETIHTVEYHLGFQYTDKNGNNRKIILQIDSEGNFVLGD